MIHMTNQVHIILTKYSQSIPNKENYILYRDLSLLLKSQAFLGGEQGRLQCILLEVVRKSCFVICLTFLIFSIIHPKIVTVCWKYYILPSIHHPVESNIVIKPHFIVTIVQVRREFVSFCTSYLFLYFLFYFSYFIQKIDKGNSKA